MDSACRQAFLVFLSADLNAVDLPGPPLALMMGSDRWEIFRDRWGPREYRLWQVRSARWPVAVGENEEYPPLVREGY